MQLTMKISIIGQVSLTLVSPHKNAVRKFGKACCCTGGACPVRSAAPPGMLNNLKWSALSKSDRFLQFKRQTGHVAAC